MTGDAMVTKQPTHLKPKEIGGQIRQPAWHVTAMPVELLSVLPIAFPDLQLPLKTTYYQEEDKASSKDVKQDPAG